MVGVAEYLNEGEGHGRVANPIAHGATSGRKAQRRSVPQQRGGIMRRAGKGGRADSRTKGQ